MLTKQFRLAQFRLIVLVLVTVVGYAALARAKSKDDVVVLKNGDRMTGEIKKLQRGELIFKASQGGAERAAGQHLFRLEVLNAPTLSLLTGFSARRPTL